MKVKQLHVSTNTNFDPIKVSPVPPTIEDVQTSSDLQETENT